MDGPPTQAGSGQSDEFRTHRRPQRHQNLCSQIEFVSDARSPRHTTRGFTMKRAKRFWHIETRSGYFYATNQFGGFTRHGTKEEAEREIEQNIAEFGDAWSRDR